MAVTISTTPRRPITRRAAVAAVAALAAIATGCGQQQIRVYDVPKEAPSAAGARPTAATTDERATTAPLHWTLPAGWEEKPAGGMRVGSFTATGKSGRTADVSIIPLGGMPEDELANVNRWRGQIGLEPIHPDQLGAQTEPIKIGPLDGHLFDLTSREPKIDDKYRARILGAMLTRGDTTWFFKMTGDDATVAEAKPAFVQFLKSVQFSQAPEVKVAANADRPMSTNTREVPGATGDQPAWNVPADWQEQPPAAMLVASYLVTASNGGAARITISSFPGDVGGVLANVNRWRNQLGLPPVAAADLPAATRSVQVEGGQATLVDLTGTEAKSGRPARLVAVMVPRDANTWFYKLLGDESAVAQAVPGFLKFVQTVRYPHG
ncbi:MAG: hypothetical protein KGS61_02260 [Verrucomicrobia bacterium]|nr:hypothetical protein [Verrucomicrobiota bacterium]